MGRTCYFFEVQENGQYKLVQLVNGTYSVHSLAHGETFHPVVGPVEEAQALYVKQIALIDRLASAQEEFVVWDVGLGAAANSLTLLDAARKVPANLRLISFDHTIEPLRFSLQNRHRLPFLSGYEPWLHKLMEENSVHFQIDSLTVSWELHLADFPSFIAQPKAASLPKPHAILFDAYSPKKNPAMWTQPLFAGLFQLLDPNRPCTLPTYSRSTMLRVSLLLAGFYVGAGHATGEKEETTIAANSMELIAEPLGKSWLDRVKNSTSAEPLWEPVYRQAPLAAATWERLRSHPQFA